MPSTLLNSIVSYWKLDETSGTTAYDAVNYPSGNNGTETNIAQSSANGKINYGAGFNGTTSKIDFGVSKAFIGNNTTSRSFSMWIYPKSNSGVPAYFAQSYNSLDGEIYIFTEASGSNVKFAMDWKNASGGAHITPTSAADYPINNWYHIIGVIDFAGGNSYIYVNGVGTSVSNGGATAIKITAGSVNTYLGTDYASDYVTGNMDEVGIWSRALTSQEVMALYNFGNGLQYPFPNQNSMFLTF
jgi:hypothetical protein